MADHVFTEGEKKCLEQYWKECSKTPRKNLIKLVPLVLKTTVQKVGRRIVKPVQHHEAGGKMPQMRQPGQKDPRRPAVSGQGDRILRNY
ncbi:MAG: hypothetical protein IJ112_04750 [Oscillospiraceae bacterium]|nr:hypothetical protein [Oscillospiraceae bacterium]